jgi:galactose-1-phosphate uridylyltransferase
MIFRVPLKNVVRENNVIARTARASNVSITRISINCMLCDREITSVNEMRYYDFILFTNKYSIEASKLQKIGQINQAYSLDSYALYHFDADLP